METVIQTPRPFNSPFQIALILLWLSNIAIDGYNTFKHNDRDSKQACRAVSVLGAIMSLWWLCDGQQIVPLHNKEYNRDFFVYLLISILLWASSTITSPRRSDLINREQTEEWKGWMQIVFLLYHYFAAAEWYNLIRILIASYVWMTGFGNFMYFAKSKDYSLWRFAKMMFRLNFLCIVVTLVMNRPYILYYICPMHTMWFISCYTVMAIKPEWNDNFKFMGFKLIVYAMVIFVVYEIPGMCETVFLPFSLILGNYEDPHGTLHEWVFRSGLDHWSTLFGMLSAWVYPVVSTWIARVEAPLVLSSQQGTEAATTENGAANEIRIVTAVKLLIITIILITSTLYYKWIFSLPKLEYNVLHPYTSWFPILLYILLRNLWPKLRNYHLRLLEICGKITLETYLGQFHMWMARNGTHDVKALLTVIPGYPLLNFLLSTAIYMLLSQKLFDITSVLSEFMLPKLGGHVTWHTIGRMWMVIGIAFLLASSVGFAIVGNL